MNNLRFLGKGNASRRFFSKIQIKMDPFDQHLLDESILPTHASFTKEELLSSYSLLYKLRRMEQRIDVLYQDRKINGFCHLYNGQEALGVGLEMALNVNDKIITGYRQHVQAYLRGVSIYSMLCEMLGKEDGCSKGKGGSMHFYNGQNGYFGGNGIVGAQIPVGVGLAFALKYKNNKENVAVAMYGDGAANQGQLYESANMASIWKLPVIFLCEMNHYAMGTSVERSSAGGNAFHKKIYNVPGIRVNGQDVFQMREASKFAKKFATENGPIVMNVHTYRYKGHSMSDPGTTYRVQDFDKHWRDNMDPLKIAKDRLMEHKVISEEELKKIEKKISKEIDQEIKKAEESPDCDLAEIGTDVYSTVPYEVRGRITEESFVISK